MNKNRIPGITGSIRPIIPRMRQRPITTTRTALTIICLKLRLELGFFTLEHLISLDNSLGLIRFLTGFS
jgi:hypothetical protein